MPSCPGSLRSRRFHPTRRRRFDFSVAEVLLPNGEPVGHLLVFADPYARATGHLWWKTLSDPYMTLEFWTSIHGEFDDPFLWTSEDVNAAVEALQRGEWPFDQDASTTYRLRWLDVNESRRVSADVFGLDVATERRRRNRLD